MQLWAMRYQRHSSSNSNSNDSVSIIYNQRPHIKVKKTKKRIICILNQDNKNERAVEMEGSCCLEAAEYYTNYSTTRSATATARITETSNDSKMRLRQQRDDELKCERKQMLSSKSLRRFWATSTSILRAPHTSILWLTLLYTIIVMVHNCQAGVMAHEVRKDKMVEQHSTISKSHFMTHDRAKRAMPPTQYSRPLLSNDGHSENNNDDGFRPIIPKDISPEFIAQSVFTKTGQYRVFETPTSDLRHAVKAEVENIHKIPNIVEDKNKMVSETIKAEQEINARKNKTTAMRREDAAQTRVSIKNNNNNDKSTSNAPSLQSVEKSKNITFAKQIELKSNKTSTSIYAPNSWKSSSTQQQRVEGDEGRQRNVQKGNNRKTNETPTTASAEHTSSAAVAAPPPALPSLAVNASENIVVNDMRELEALLVEYAESFFNQAQYEPSPELINALQQKNHTTNTNLNDDDGGDNVDNLENYLPPTTAAGGPYKKRPTRHASPQPHPHPHPHYQHHHHHPQMFHHQELHHHHHRHLHHALPPSLQQPAVIERKADGDISLNIPRAMDSGRLLFSTGLKKMLWPIFMGLQVLKSLLFALFLPTLIGSFGKLLGKGIVSGSAPLFIRPADAPQDLDFRDNTINFDDEKFAIVDEGTKEDGYGYNQAEAASQTHYTYNAAGINRIEQQQNKMPDTYLNALQTIGSASFKNSGSLSGTSSGGLGGGGGLGAPLRTKPAAPANTNNFQTFQKVPASSLLLSNYDPFYSPLLSRLDSVFAALKLNSDNENCREKLICLMYANPAKYAPYSNLVSAQLSRELNELRKPTSDNPDILRFFKYMRAAKDGQDGVDCEKSFDQCKEFKDFENPAMVSTYHDINKLVQARKLA